MNGAGPAAAPASREELAERLLDALRRRLPGAHGVRNLVRLSGGASQETFSFEAETDRGPLPLVLRRSPGGAPRRGGMGSTLSLEDEARVVARAAAAGVPVPGILFVLEPADGLGSGFVMRFLEGESLPRRILRDAAFARLREGLAAECGRILARIHAVDPQGIAGLESVPPELAVERCRKLLRAFDVPRPVIELALVWLEDHLPPPVPQTLVHGDFRNGNLLVGPEGVRAVLDWELAHVGDPAEDLGWLCANVWRFGERDRRVGGFGDLPDLLAAYEEAGGRPIPPERVLWFEVLAGVKWTLGCSTMAAAFANGVDRNVERAAVGRRASENEVDLLHLIDPERGVPAGGA